jgi:uncharacterized membrane protein YphA (DoxX/SURF4 family)
METGKVKNIITILLSIGLALFFLFAGGTKLAGLEVHIENFRKLGLPVWFMYVTGAVEVAGAFLLIVPFLRFYGALLLAGTMGGAVLTQVVAGEVAAALLPLAFLFLSLGLAWLSRPEWLRSILCHHRVTGSLLSCK